MPALRPSAAVIVAFAAALALLACGDTDDAGPTEVTFIDLRVEDVTHARAVVRFDTSEPTTCEVEFGIAADQLDRIAVDPSMIDDDLSFEHDVPLEDLTPSTMYWYRARAEDANGDVWLSEIASFTTAEGIAGIDGVNVASIAAGATVLDVSSSFGGSATWAAENAFDGQMATEWSSQGDGDDAFVTVQLAGQRTLTGFAFRSRSMPDGTAIVTSVQLVVEPDGDAPQTLGPFETPDPDQAYVFVLEPAPVAQVVRLEVVTSTGGNTGAREIQLFAPTL